MGQMIRQYEILEKIGTGGFGEVYRAKDTRLHRMVAVKVLLKDHRGDEELENRFLTEARTLAAITHPSVVVIHEINRTDDVFYIVMELLDGETLEDRVKRCPLTPEETLEFGASLADALSHIHSEGVIHRDVKPANIMITADGRPKLMDFGISRFVKRKLTKEGLVSGSLGYMSPEQLRAQPLDGRSDLFSLGAVLYEALTGRMAFMAKTEVECIEATLNQDPKRLRKLDESIPESLDHIIHKALRKKKEGRFRNGKEMREAFGELQMDLNPEIKRVRKKGYLFTGAILLVALILTWILWPSQLDLEIGVYRKAQGASESVPFSNGGVVTKGDELHFQFNGNREYYLYVLLHDSSGEWFALFPDHADTSGPMNPLPGGDAMRLPEGEETFVIDDQPGEERVWIVASRVPIDELEEQIRQLPDLGGERRQGIDHIVVAKLEDDISKVTRKRGMFLSDGSKSLGSSVSANETQSTLSVGQSSSTSLTPGYLGGMYQGGLQGRERVSVMLFLDHK